MKNRTISSESRTYLSVWRREHDRKTTTTKQQNAIPRHISSQFNIDHNCGGECVLSEETILSIGRLHHEIQSQYGCKYFVNNNNNSVRWRDIINLDQFYLGNLYTGVHMCADNGEIDAEDFLRTTTIRWIRGTY